MSTDFADTWRARGFNPDNVRLAPRLPFVPRTFDPMEKVQNIIEGELAFRDRLVLPICPCCGRGRTLFVHLATEPALVIPAQFSDWCDGCRKQLAAKLK